MNTRSIFKNFIIVLLFGWFICLPIATVGIQTANAVDLNKELDAVAGPQGAGLVKTDVTKTVAIIIQTVLGLLGITFLILILYAGFLWMTAGGNSEQIKKAKGLLINATVGLAIILASYGIASFVIDRLVEATGGTTTGKPM